nr:MAG TPA: hypothetical protein [Caudoviricetes sp.]
MGWPACGRGCEGRSDWLTRPLMRAGVCARVRRRRWRVGCAIGSNVCSMTQVTQIDVVSDLTRAVSVWL